MRTFHTQKLNAGKCFLAAVFASLIFPLMAWSQGPTDWMHNRGQTGGVDWTFHHPALEAKNAADEKAYEEGKLDPAIQAYITKERQTYAREAAALGIHTIVSPPSTPTYSPPSQQVILQQRNEQRPENAEAEEHEFFWGKPSADPFANPPLFEKYEAAPSAKIQ
jgi:hypothetical protein